MSEERMPDDEWAGVKKAQRIGPCYPTNTAILDEAERARASEVDEEARADALEADCAAVRRALEAAQWGGGALGMKCPDQRCGNYRPRHQPDCAIGMALATDSGKRLLEEHAAKVRALSSERDARLTPEQTEAMRYEIERQTVRAEQALGMAAQWEAQAAAKDKRIAELETMGQGDESCREHSSCDAINPHPRCVHPHRCFKDGRWLDDGSEM